MGAESIPQTIWWQDDTVRLIDQSRLPLVGDVLSCGTHEGICWAIEGMAIRGAPALGVAAAMGLALFARNESEDIDNTPNFIAQMAMAADRINATRPTAINLFWGTERVMGVAVDNIESSVEELRQIVVDEALAIHAEDIERNKALGAAGAELIEDGMQVMTHCNAGSLATAHWGTALGVVYSAMEAGRTPRVWVRETRPVLQGSRLSMWELMTAGVPCKLIADSAAGMLMRAGAVDIVIVGADRIAANGDVANKIGTYGLAVLAKTHGIPFYVAAPSSTVDLTSPTGAEITIEERDPREVSGFTATADFTPGDDAQEAFEALASEQPFEVPLRHGSTLMLTAKERAGESDTDEQPDENALGAYQLDGHWRLTPQDADIFNPAFDITTADLIEGIITENGISRPPYAESLPEALEGTGAYHELRTPPEEDDAE